MEQSKVFSWHKKFENSDQVDFRTPPYLFKFITSIYGRIDYDGACFEDGSNSLAKPLRLEDEWPSGIVYSNPPFDDKSIIKWIQKGHKHVMRNPSNKHIILIPNKLTHVKIIENAFSLIDRMIILGGRINFISDYAVKGGTSRNGNLILIQDSTIENPGFEFVTLKKLKEVYR